MNQIKINYPGSLFSVGLITKQWAEEANIHTWYQHQTSSTNEMAKTQAFSDDAEINSSMLYLTDHQTQGRGRGTHIWKDNGEASYLLSTWSFLISFAPQPIMTCRLGLAVFRSLIATWSHLPLSLKAPNDLFIGAKKVGGILVENLQEGQENRLLVGIGLNVFAHPGLPDSTSLIENLPDPNLITQKDWKEFLERLHLELTLVSQNRLGTLTVNERANLLHALNMNPRLEEPLTEIESNGNLVSAQKKVLWSEL